MRPSFVFDANHCTGCQACELACVIENNLPFQAGWRQVHTFNAERLPGIPLFHLSLACNHCAEPACAEACPALAYHKDPRTGALLIEQDKCIGCRYCSWACPYDAPRYDLANGVMTKCTFCNGRIHEGRGPACAELCPTGALRFERLDENELVHESPGFPATELGPAIRIVPRRERAEPPESAEPPAAFSMPRQPAPPRIGLRSEWSLVVFTLVAPLLFALLAAAAAGEARVSPFVFAGAAVTGMALGAAHLGRKARAWRAILGFRRSWLSREIVFFSAFAAVGTLHLAWAPGARWSGALALALGAATLFSMDRVYRYAVKGVGPRPHSASVLLIGLFLSALLIGQPLAAGLLGLARLLLYAWRKVALAAAGRPLRPGWTLLRVACGFLLPAFLWTAFPQTHPALVAAPILLGELVDRGEFYADLDFNGPARQLILDLAARVGR